MITPFLHPSPSSKSKDMVGATGSSSTPSWLHVLLGEKFFSPCHLHDAAKKNAKNVFCLECCASLCPHCLPLHESHSLLQIRRYVYRDVVRLDDVQKLLNCSHVQPYITNSAKVVFLKQRPKSRPFKGSGYFCATCDRSLQEGYFFCSLSCKVQHQMTNNFGLKRQLYDDSSKHKSLSSCSHSNSKYNIYLTKYLNSKSKNYNNYEDDHLIQDYAIGPPEHEPTSSRSNPIATTSHGRRQAPFCNALTSTTGVDFLKKKRATLSVDRVASKLRCLPSSDITSLMNRRKGIPRRSHLY